MFTIQVVCSLFYLFCCFFLSTFTSALPTLLNVSINWSNVTVTTQTIPTLQIVLNPLITRESPIHDAVYDNLQALHTDFTRFQSWFPYPKLACPQLDEPSGVYQCRNVAEQYNLTLSCARKGGVISSIDFASYGTPEGTCGSFSLGKCHANDSLSIVTKLCLGRQNCTILANNSVFQDPCVNTPKRLAVQVQCNPPQNHSYWDFTYLDPIVEDFIAATVDHIRLLDFSTSPNWLWNLSSPVYYPDNPYERDFSYSADAATLKDPTAEQIGQYWGRLVAHYTSGGHYDEYGEFFPSPYHYRIDYFEVMNEMEHSPSPELYTKIYDQTVRYIREYADPDHKIQFMGLALEQGQSDDYFTYFLNRSNHIDPNVPLDFISFHRYSLPNSRSDPNAFEQIVQLWSEWLTYVNTVKGYRDTYSPTTKLDIDEAGVILPNDNDDPTPPIHPLYWPAAGSGFMFFFSELSKLGVDVLGCSQLVGFPELPDVLGGQLAQYPSVAMLNWTDGSGTQKYWGLKLLIENFGPGDQVIETVVAGNNASSNPYPLYAQAFITPLRQLEKADGWVPDEMVRKLLIVNTANTVINVTIPGATGGIASVLDASTGNQAAHRITLKSDELTLAEFAGVIIRFSPSSRSSLS